LGQLFASAKNRLIEVKGYASDFGVSAMQPAYVGSALA